MTESKKKTFDYLLERYFKPEVEAKNYKDLLKLEMNSLKNLNEETISALKSISVKTIKDLLEVKLERIEIELSKKEMTQEDLDFILIALKILKKLLEPKAREKVEITSKLGVMGMQNAGKTSFINFLMGKTTDEKFKETEPTVSVDHKIMQLGDMTLAIWDFGGQESFRKEYLDKPEDFFVGIEVILYVIDVQDEDTFADSIAYLFSVLSMMKKLGEKAHIIVDLHKCDPDILKDINFVIKLQWLEEKILEILDQFEFSYEFMRSSIFTGTGSPEEPEMSKNLKEIFISKTGTEVKSSEMEMLKNILYIQTKIYTSLMNGFMELTNAVNILGAKIAGEQGDQASQTYPTQIPDFPPPPSVIPSPSSVGPIESPRGTIVAELKELFKRKRMQVP